MTRHSTASETALISMWLSGAHDHSFALELGANVF